MRFKSAPTNGTVFYCCRCWIWSRNFAPLIFQDRSGPVHVPSCIFFFFPPFMQNVESNSTKLGHNFCYLYLNCIKRSPEILISIFLDLRPQSLDVVREFCITHHSKPSNGRQHFCSLHCHLFSIFFNLCFLFFDPCSRLRICLVQPIIHGVWQACDLWPTTLLVASLLINLKMFELMLASWMDKEINLLSKRPVLKLFWSQL